MPNVQCVYAIGGPSIAVTIAVTTNSTIPIPVLDDGTRAHWIVCQTIEFGANVTWVRTGAASDVMDGLRQGITLNRNYGDTVLDVPRGHTNIHIFGQAITTIMVTPLAERPTR